MFFICKLHKLNLLLVNCILTRVPSEYQGRTWSDYTTDQTEIFFYSNICADSFMLRTDHFHPFLYSWKLTFCIMLLGIKLQKETELYFSLIRQFYSQKKRWSEAHTKIALVVYKATEALAMLNLMISPWMNASLKTAWEFLSISFRMQSNLVNEN